MLCALQGLWARHRTRRSPFACVDTAPWPAFTVFVLAQAPDGSLSACLQALLGTAYPPQALRIVPICDAADAHSGAIVKAYAHLFPERVLPCRRSSSDAGALAAVREALPVAHGDLALVLGSHQLPGPGLFKHLARPFFDPEVGMVTSSTQTSDANALAAVRLSAVQAAGGWSGEGLADVDRLSRRMKAAGWARVVTPEAVWLAAPPLRPRAAPGEMAAPAPEPLAETPPPQTRAAPVLMEHR
jgi:cellulose synthase/poly-beta-1,6-N-acetylglucosamine synthase-like glycosyltransferase